MLLQKYVTVLLRESLFVVFRFDKYCSFFTLIYYSWVLQLLSHSQLFSLFNFQGAFPFRVPLQKKKGLVGTSGFGPPTSRLSGVRSNQLSYAPMLVGVTPWWR